jgi:hypothetical protein
MSHLRIALFVVGSSLMLKAIHFFHCLHMGREKKHTNHFTDKIHHEYHRSLHPACLTTALFSWAKVAANSLV